MVAQLFQTNRASITCHKIQNGGARKFKSDNLLYFVTVKQGWKLALTHLPRRVSKLLGRVQIVDFLLHLFKALAQQRVLSKLSFHL